MTPLPHRDNPYLPADLDVGPNPPDARPLDEVAQARIRRLLAARFGESPTLAAHVALLDTRGAWYARAAMHAWAVDGLDTFFGVVRHVIRTQLNGPPPAPDLEGWLHAGRPADADLAEWWDLLRDLRYPPPRRPSARPRDAAITESVAVVDRVLRSWPAGHRDEFTLAYARLENVLERRAIGLPPISV